MHRYFEFTYVDMHRYFEFTYVDMHVCTSEMTRFKLEPAFEAAI
jgi:hypothetical protein